MRCDERLELRVTGSDKRRLRHRAKEMGISLSALLRRALKIALGDPAALTQDGVAEMGSFRRRLNALEALVERLSSQDGDVAVQLRADIHQMRIDMQRTLGRCS